MKTIVIKMVIFLSLFLFVAVPSSFSAPKEDGVFAELKTNKGIITVRLFYKRAPKTVLNFIKLSEDKFEWSKLKGEWGTLNRHVRNPKEKIEYDKIVAQKKRGYYYDNITFHRVIPNFMIQVGDATGTGMGGPGYKFADEFDPSLLHTKAGMLSMANSGPNSNGSQFFVTHKATPWLDCKHAIFGEVVEQGQKVVNSIKKGDKMYEVIIIRNGKEAKAFNARTAKNYGKFAVTNTRACLAKKKK